MGKVSILSLKEKVTLPKTRLSLFLNKYFMDFKIYMLRK